MAKKDYFDNVMSSRYVTSRIVFRILGEGDKILTVEKDYGDREISLNKNKIGKRTRVDGVSYAITDIFEEETALVMVLEDPEKYEARRALELEEKKNIPSEDAENVLPEEKPAKERKEWEDADDDGDVGLSCENEETSDADLDSPGIEVS